MRTLKTLRTSHKGFTLIELLVVIAILGVIAVVALPNVIKFVSAGDVPSQQTELHDVQAAIGAYLTDHNNTLAAFSQDGILVNTGGNGVGAYLLSSTQYQYSWDANGLNIVQGLKATTWS